MNLRKALIAWLIFPALTLLCLNLTHQPILAAPEPALVPGPNIWQLELELHGEPQQLTMKLPTWNKPRTYWYMPYTITNNTGRDVDFYPQFDLLTDTFSLVHGGVEVRKPVFDRIKQLYSTTLPYLEPESEITGRILQGQDNARSSVIIFRDFDPNATSVKIFIAGLSNETVKVLHPAAINPRTKMPKEVLLRKSLMLQYDVPGDRFNPENRVMLYRGREWLMRSMSGQ